MSFPAEITIRNAPTTKIERAIAPAARKKASLKLFVKFSAVIHGRLPKHPLNQNCCGGGISTDGGSAASTAVIFQPEANIAESPVIKYRLIWLL